MAIWETRVRDCSLSATIFVTSRRSSTAVKYRGRPFVTVHGQCREIVQSNRLESYRFTSPRNWKELGEILTRRSARSSSISERSKQNIRTIYVYAIFKVFIKHS